MRLFPNIKRAIILLMVAGCSRHAEQENTKFIGKFSAELAKCYRENTNFSKHTQAINIHLDLNIDSSLKSISLAKDDEQKYHKNPEFKKNVDETIIATKNCFPVTTLPKSQFSVWNSIDINFQPCTQAQ